MDPQRSCRGKGFREEDRYYQERQWSSKYMRKAFWCLRNPTINLQFHNATSPFVRLPLIDRPGHCQPPGADVAMTTVYIYTWGWIQAGGLEKSIDTVSVADTCSHVIFQRWFTASVRPTQSPEQSAFIVCLCKPQTLTCLVSRLKILSICVYWFK